MTESSYRLASRLAGRSGSNFYHSFALLPPEKRRGVTALYAFARLTDDMGDGPGTPEQRSGVLALWRRRVTAALGAPRNLASQSTAIPERDVASAIEPSDRRWVAASVLPPGAEELLPALTDTARRFEIPHEYLLGIVDGVLADQSQRRFETFAALDQYCYLVASTVGLACVHVWGSRTPLPLQAAIDCGLAFQLTNILRDLREDAARDRIYLPKELWNPLRLEECDMLDVQPSPAMAAVVSQAAERASDLYRRGWEVFPVLHPDGQRMFSMIWRTYRSLLARIERDPSQVLSRRVRVGLGSRLWIAGTHFFGPAFDRLPDPREDARFVGVSPERTDGDCRVE